MFRFISRLFSKESNLPWKPNVGFDWENTEQIFEKLAEEITELKKTIEKNDVENINEEIGDLFFVVVNLARKLNVEPETALKKTNRKFRRRFNFIEKELKTVGKNIEGANLAEMDELWNRAKAWTHQTPRKKRRMGGFNDDITQGAEGALDILCANYYELNKLLNIFTLNFLVHIHTICWNNIYLLDLIPLLLLDNTNLGFFGTVLAEVVLSGKTGFIPKLF